MAYKPMGSFINYSCFYYFIIINFFITMRLPCRSTQLPSSTAPTATAATSATNNAAICSGVARRFSAASHGIAKRLSMVPKLEMLSATSTRGTSCSVMSDSRVANGPIIELIEARPSRLITRGVESWPRRSPNPAFIASRKS